MAKFSITTSTCFLMMSFASSNFMSFVFCSSNSLARELDDAKPPEVEVVATEVMSFRFCSSNSLARELDDAKPPEVEAVATEVMPVDITDC